MKKVFALALIIALCLAMAAPALATENTSWENSTLYILMYHDMVEEGYQLSDWVTTADCFREDMRWLIDNG